MIDWTTAYDNRAAVPGSETLPERWAAAAARHRERLGARLETVATGEAPRARMELQRPEGEPRGLAVFVHGGYWMRNEPALFSHLAAGALARGWAVALPGYTLCPEATVAQITAEVATAVAAAAERVTGPIRIAGHSAGGHLAARMLSGALGGVVLERVAGLLSISGIHDLRPLLRTPMNPTLGLDLATARAESPALAEPAAGVPVTAWVGAAELPELRRQSRLLVELWGGLGLATRLVEDPGHDHFSVIEALVEPDSPLTAAFLGD